QGECFCQRLVTLLFSFSPGLIGSFLILLGDLGLLLCNQALPVCFRSTPLCFDRVFVRQFLLLEGNGLLPSCFLCVSLCIFPRGRRDLRRLDCLLSCCICDLCLFRGPVSVLLREDRVLLCNTGLHEGVYQSNQCHTRQTAEYNR